MIRAVKITVDHGYRVRELSADAVTLLDLATCEALNQAESFFAGLPYADPEREVAGVRLATLQKLQPLVREAVAILFVVPEGAS